MREIEAALAGRFIDPALGTLEGEAAGQDTSRALARPGPAALESEGPSYYGQPVLQKPVWIWTIPAYFYVGGSGGAALTLASAVQSVGDLRLHGLVKRLRWMGSAGLLLGTGFLIVDLGRPSRFLNMLRVFRPSSPLSVGSWLLAAAGPLAGGAALFADSTGVLRRLADLAGHAAGLVGMPLAGYTAVVLADTAVPVWQQSRRALPVAFVGSAMAGTASLLDLMDLAPRERRVARRFAIAGKAAELGGMLAVEHEASRLERVGAPLAGGLSGFLWKAAKILSAASLLVSLMPGRFRRKRAVSGILGTAGAISLRYALMEAGKRSAADPQATFAQQRAGHVKERPGVEQTVLPAPERARTTSG